jgi:hypothetical protein
MCSPDLNQPVERQQQKRKLVSDRCPLHPMALYGVLKFGGDRGRYAPRHSTCEGHERHSHLHVLRFEFSSEETLP